LKEGESEEVASCYRDIGLNNNMLGKLDRAMEFL
jgi:hypothetical protein